MAAIVTLVLEELKQVKVLQQHWKCLRTARKCKQSRLLETGFELGFETSEEADWHWELGRLRGSELGDKAETRVWLGVVRATGLCSEF